MSENKSKVQSKAFINTSNQIKISTIANMQSLPEEIVLNMLQTRGKLVKDKKGKLIIAQGKSRILN